SVYTLIDFAYSASSYSSLISSLLPPPPNSTLFPYTTLFRSALAAPHPHRGARLHACIGRGTLLLPDPRRGPVLRPRRYRSTLGRDRKSTRLNSSHVSISYAVFCLKKKKT